MKYPILIILIFLVKFISYSQEKCGIILDKKNHTPVSYATIYYSNSAIGTFTDENGKYCISSPNIKTDSVYISALGYSKLLFSYHLFIKTDTIYVENLPIELDNVTIKSRKGKRYTKEVGYAKKPLIELTENGYMPNSNMRIATYISNKGNEEWLIHMVHCRIIPKENDLVQFFRIRLRIYTHDNIKCLPKQDLLNENITIDISPKEKKIDFDLTKYSLIIPNNGFWIGIESIGYINKSGIYIPIRNYEFGKFTLKDSKKFKLKSIDRITPMYRYVNTSPKSSAVSSWGGEWRHEKLYEKLTFLFGAEIETFK